MSPIWVIPGFEANFPQDNSGKNASMSDDSNDNRTENIFHTLGKITGSHFEFLMCLHQDLSRCN